MIRLRRLAPVFLLVLAACGADSDSSSTEAPSTDPPATDPPATDPPATDPPASDPPATDPAVTDPPATDPPPATDVPLDTRLELGEFFVMEVAPGWDVRSVSQELGRTFEEGQSAPWQWSDSDQHDIAALSNGSVEMTVFREGRYALAPGVFEWDSAIIEALAIQPNIQVTTEWGGGRGNSTRGTIGGELFARLDTTEVDGQLIAALALTPDEPGPEVDAEIDAMLASTVVDASQIPLLNHSIDARVEATEADTGSTPFRIGILTEPNWVTSIDSDTVFVDPEGDGFIEVFLALTDGEDFDSLVADEIEANADFFDVEPVIEDVEIDGVRGRVYWEGDPATAMAAIVLTDDGVVFGRTTLYAPDRAGLLQAMVDDIEIRFSAVNPE